MAGQNDKWMTLTEFVWYVVREVRDAKTVLESFKLRLDKHPYEAMRLSTNAFCAVGTLTAFNPLLGELEGMLGTPQDFWLTEAQASAVRALISSKVQGLSRTVQLPTSLETSPAWLLTHVALRDANARLLERIQITLDLTAN